MNWKSLKSEGVIPYIIFFAFFVFYLKSLSPGIFWDDSGELGASAYFLGIPHPTGYPHYSILVKLFSFLPLGNIIYRMSIFSAFCGSLSAVFIFLTAKVIAYHNLKAAFPAIFFGFSLALCEFSTTNEVYTYASFWLTLTVFFFWWIAVKGGDHRLLLLSGLIFGMALSHHLMQLLIFPSLIHFFIKFRKRNSLKPQTLLGVILGLICGLSTFIYLPLRSTSDPILNWGQPDNFIAFLNHISAHHFKARFIFATQEILYRIINLPSLFYRNFPLSILILALLGAFFSRRKVYSPFFLLLFISNLLLVFYLPANFFFIPAFISIAIFATEGLFFIIEHICPLGKLSHFILIFLISVLVNNQILKNFSPSCKTYNHNVQRWVKNAINLAPYRAIVFTQSDNLTFPLWYLNWVEKYRDDLIILHRPAFSWRGYVKKLIKSKVINFPDDQKFIRVLAGDTSVLDTSDKSPFHYLISRLIEANIKEREILWEAELYQEDMMGESIFPDRYLFTFREKQEENLIAYLNNLYSELSSDPFFRCDEKAHQMFATNCHILAWYFEKEKDKEKELVCLNLATLFDPFGAYAYNKLGIIFVKRNDYANAERYFLKALSLDKRMIDGLVNLGILYQIKGENNKAITYYQRALFWEPKHFQARLNKGVALFNSGKVKKAIVELEKASFLNPQSPLPLQALVQAYQISGELEKRDEMLEKLARIQPKNDEQ